MRTFFFLWLAARGFTQVLVFKGGYAAWWKAGLPIEKLPEMK